ncbi:MAG: hypothetical protein K2M27_08040 [Muribaculaceae bacterium]|nr:hypothetical protein [Muribaculaceae bacterium]
MKDYRLSIVRNVPALLLVFLLSFVTVSCSDDEPPQRSEYDILGIWQDKEGHYLEFVNPDRMYEYEFTVYEGVDYWVKKREMYFFEPYSYLMMKEDTQGAVHVYQVVSVNEEELVICWVATPDMSGMEGEDKFQLFSVFFNQDYEVDPAKYETYRKVTQEELDKALEGVEVLEP